MSKQLIRMIILFALVSFASLSLVAAQSDVDFPVLDDAFSIISNEDNLLYESPTPLAAAIEFYKRELAVSGWTLSSEIEGRGRTGTILVFVNAAGDDVTIVFGEGPALDGQVRDVTKVTIDHPFGQIEINPRAGTIESNTQESSNTVSEITSNQPLESPLNIELVYDASGSMADNISGESKIEAARQTIELLVESLPLDDGNLNVGFRVFGHEGDNTEVGRAVSCASTELVVPVDGVDSNLLIEQAATYTPTGWTPIALALQEAAADFPVGENGRNVIILVSDGDETCGGDPVASALALAQSDANIVTHVIGFDLDVTSARNLSAIAFVTNGFYLNATDSNTLAGAILGVVSAEFQLSGGLFLMTDTIIERFEAGSADFDGIVIEDGRIQIDSFLAGSADFTGVEIDLNTGRITIDSGTAGNIDLEDLGVDLSEIGVEIEIPEINVPGG